MEAVVQLEDQIAQHRAEVLAFLIRRSPTDGEELAQETWLRVARSAPRCPDARSFRAYVFTVARRVLVDHYRRRSARIRLVPLDGDAAEPPSTHPGDRPDARRQAADVLLVVERTLAKMKPELAQVFRWRAAEDVPFKEIARRQGVSLNTALGRMHQATKKIQAALSAQGLMTARLKRGRR